MAGDDDGGTARVALEVISGWLIPPFLYLGLRARNSSKLKSSVAGCIIFEDAFDPEAEFVVGGALIVALLLTGGEVLKVYQ